MLGLSNFDLTKSYRVVAYGRDDNGGEKSLQSLSLDFIDLPDGYTIWRDSQASIIGTEEDDPDGDGTPNLLEYVLGGNPLVVDSSHYPCFQLVGSDNVFAFNRSIEARNSTNQVLQFSNDLVNWNARAELPLTGDVLPAAVTIQSRVQRNGVGFSDD